MGRPDRESCYYKTLDVDKKATKQEIKKAFRKLSKIHHPDAGGDEEQFKIIQEAYETLSDDDKRAAYDSGGVYMSSNDKERKARSNLLASFLSAVMGGLIGDTNTNPFEMMMEQIVRAEGELKGQIRKQHEDIRRYNKIMKRMKPKGSIFHRALEDEIDMCDHNITNIDILAKGDFDFEQEGSNLRGRAEFLDGGQFRGIGFGNSDY